MRQSLREQVRGLFYKSVLIRCHLCFYTKPHLKIWWKFNLNPYPDQIDPKIFFTWIFGDENTIMTWILIRLPAPLQMKAIDRQFHPSTRKQARPPIINVSHLILKKRAYYVKNKSSIIHQIVSSKTLQRFFSNLWSM